MTGPRTLSLNEVEQLSLKASRGAGASWGVAEDVARAVRWLAERGIDWCAALIAMLSQTPPADPLARALAVADRLTRAAPGDRWMLEGCAPGWVVPALATAAANGSVEVRWKTGTVRLARLAQTADLRPEDMALFAPAPIAVTVLSGASPLACPWPPMTRRSSVPARALATLEAFASRTYVAASERSRAAGAGGGRVDED